MNSILTVKNKSAILTLLCFGVIILSMFLPFYEGPRIRLLIPTDSFSIVRIYKLPAFRATMIVFNGFGSLFALCNLAISCVLVAAQFLFRGYLATALSTAFVFICSLGLLIYETSEKHGRPFEDTMLIGFYLMLTAIVVLIAQAFTQNISAPPKDKRTSRNSDILDF